MATGIIGIILAGGLSRRMGGGAKALMPLAGRPMVAHVIGRIAPYVDACVLNVNGDASAFAQFGLPIVADSFGDYAGPLAGLLSGMRWAAEHRLEARWVVTAPCDTPLLPENYVDALAAEGPDGATVVIAASGGREHFASGLWPVALADELAAFLASGERRIQSWIERNPNKTLTFPLIDDGRGGVDPFFNVNTPEELAMAERFASERPL
ncbi:MULTISPECIES: molybdenum cofactor guanylyltransferase MobA [Rhodomicrobium]|uniref:molybdenum cofactor guanylyltransferase MobA n=1 Tax=Rhodomicrobium TaxID=1068 RepID=UPI000B4BFC72|nr:MULTISPECIES: molybdenum cofactor guanylyltransferase MobA [Rhodomicrobium]